MCLYTYVQMYILWCICRGNRKTPGICKKGHKETTKLVLHVAFATLPKLWEQATLPTPTQIPLNPWIKCPDTRVAQFQLAFLT